MSATNPDGRATSPYPVKVVAEPTTAVTALEDFIEREPVVVAMAQSVDLEEVDRGDSAV